jgi:hypothetical protein
MCSYVALHLRALLTCVDLIVAALGPGRGFFLKQRSSVKFYLVCFALLCIDTHYAFGCPMDSIGCVVTSAVPLVPSITVVLIAVRSRHCIVDRHAF